MDTASKKLKNLPRRFNQRCLAAGISIPWFKKGETENVCYVSLKLDALRIEYHADSSVTCSIVTQTDWRGPQSIHLPAHASIDDVFGVFVDYLYMEQRQ
jgi:hypothetical protein